MIPSTRSIARQLKGAPSASNYESAATVTMPSKSTEPSSWKSSDATTASCANCVAQCPHDLLEDLLHGGNITRDEALSVLPDMHRPALNEFLKLSATRAAGPRCTVRYRRQAYVGIDDLDTRVTFDRHLSTLPTESTQVRHRDPCYIAVPTGGVILELKYTNQMPPWMAATIRKLELQRRSFSKYCSSVDAERH